MTCEACESQVCRKHGYSIDILGLRRVCSALVGLWFKNSGLSPHPKVIAPLARHAELHEMSFICLQLNHHDLFMKCLLRFAIQSDSTLAATSIFVRSLNPGISTNC